jgi:cytochrome b pre-mRNA-processing protein 3
VGLLGFILRNRHEKTSFKLFEAAVTAARDPFCYTAVGVPDTLDGRFEMVGLYTFLIIRRLCREPMLGPAVAQAVFDAMFRDVDQTLREMGTGDLFVGRKVRVMWEAFHGRSVAYAESMEAGDSAALEVGLARNVWRSKIPSNRSVELLRRIVFSQDAYLGTQALDRLTQGEVHFLRAEDAI